MRPWRFLLVVCMSVPALLASGVRAETLSDLQKRQDLLRLRLDEWYRLANRDPREDWIDEYKRYTEDDFKKKKRVRLEQIVEIFADPTLKDGELRIRARVLVEAAAVTTWDPDIILERSGGGTVRSAWANKHLKPLLTKDGKEGDLVSRGTANHILLKWFPDAVNGRNAAAIVSYNPEQSKKSSWGPAA